MATALVSTGPYLKTVQAVTANTNIASPTSGQTVVAAQGMSTGKVVIEGIDFSALTDTTQSGLSVYLYDGTNPQLLCPSIDIPQWTTRYGSVPIVSPYRGGVPLRGGQVDLPDDTWKIIATVYTTQTIELTARGKIYG